ncbi:hypothetical protein Golob_018945 [Gossypium lobatum]|uniref:Uncharacterized protein n=1 Tax=Gossypium lobatum TaxID=34289 RepID=A0A7J8L5U8_9ROSI|nr:hypothetical protein [Gossypium lobatum]
MYVCPSFINKKKERKLPVEGDGIRFEVIEGDKREAEVMEHGFVSLSWIHRGLHLTCPYQAESWAEGIERKLRFSWFLEWRILREAGFTEQRSSPVLGSERITSQFH